MFHTLICADKNIPLLLDGDPELLSEPGRTPHYSLPARIVIIEDNPGDVFIMEEALREYSVNCSVTVLSDGEQANEFFGRIDRDTSIQCPSLILLDLNLPKRSGHWVLTRIRSTERCAMIPVIIVSSSDVPSDLIANRKLGASAYFQKPTSLEEFLKLGAVVESLLR